ncbi:MAG: PorT family protein [Paramuribaculum sp.]|nr:PorT family protein [Paramuribaculum sp.]
MKKYLITLLLITAGMMFMLPSASAQRYYEPHFWIGAKGGMTLGHQEFSPNIRQSFAQGATGGLTFRYSEEKLFGLIAELNFTQRGWKEDYEEDNDRFNYKRQLTYIQIPVMTHIYFGSRTIKGFINLGPSVGYMIGSKISSNFDYHNPKSVEGFPYRYRYTDQLWMDIKNKFDYGICGGAGVELFFGKYKRHSIVLEGRYYFGLGSIFPNHKSDTFSSSRGTSIEVTMGYNFKVK